MKKIIASLIFIVAQYFGIAQNWELNTLQNINPNQTHSSFQVNISKSVYPLSIATPLTILGIGLINRDKKMQQSSYKIIGSLLINTAITQGLKYAINRNRPYQDYPNIIQPYTIENDASFPSGHTSTAFALATSISLEYKKWYVVVPCFAYASAVGYSRMYLGEHYPTDVIAGAAIGIGGAYLSKWINKKIFK